MKYGRTCALKCGCTVLAVQYACTPTYILDNKYGRTGVLKCVCLHLECSARVLRRMYLVLSRNVLVR